MTNFQSDWREPQICQLLFLKSDYLDKFPVWLEGAPDLSTSFFKKWLFWQFSSRSGGSLRSVNFFLWKVIILTIFQSEWREPQICRFLSSRAHHEQKCFTWNAPTNRNALLGTPPRTEMLYLRLPTNRNVLPSGQEPSKTNKTLGFSLFFSQNLKNTS